MDRSYHRLIPGIAVDRIISVMKDLLFLLDSEGRIILVNPAVCNALEYSEEDLVGKQ